MPGQMNTSQRPLHHYSDVI